MTALLEVRDLTVTLGPRDARVAVLDRVSFTLAAGGALGLVGESGSGKSMTALAIAGLLPEGAGVSGSIRLSGVELPVSDDPAMSRIRGKRIGMVFQEPMTSLNPVMSIGAQVAEGLMLAGASREAATARAVEMLGRVGLGAISPRRFPHELSGGQRQRVMIAMALAPGPELLIADEPTTALDVTTQAEVLDLIAEASAAIGAALIVISHDLGVIARSADHMAVMYHGRIVERGPTAQVFAQMAHPYTRGLMAAMPDRRMGGARGPDRLATIPGQVPSSATPRTPCVFEARCPVAAEVCTTEPPAASVGPDHVALCARLEAARGAFAIPAEAARQNAMRVESGGPILVIRDLVREHPLPRPTPFSARPHFRALDGVSLTVAPGESLGVIGESGSGKSTLARIALALETPSRGSVTLFGEDLARASRDLVRRLRRKAQIVFQDPYGSLDPRRTILETVGEPLAALAPEVSATERRRRVADSLAAVGVPEDSLSRYPHEFSGGQRQRIAIARALVTEPELIVADEPVSALDVSVQAQVLNLLADIRRARRLAFLFVSHDLSVVRHVTDRVIVLHRGRIVEEGPTLEVLARPQHAYTQALVAAVPTPDPSRRRRNVSSGRSET